MNEIIWYSTFSPEYFINLYGDVRTFDRCEYMPYKNSVRKIQRNGRILKSIKMNNGYLYVDLAKSGKVKRMSVHRLMAKHSYLRILKKTYFIILTETKKIILFLI